MISEVMAPLVLDYSMGQSHPQTVVFKELNSSALVLLFLNRYQGSPVKAADGLLGTIVLGFGCFRDCS